MATAPHICVCGVLKSAHASSSSDRFEDDRKSGEARNRQWDAFSDERATDLDEEGGGSTGAAINVEKYAAKLLAKAAKVSSSSQSSLLCSSCGGDTTVQPE